MSSDDGENSGGGAAGAPATPQKQQQADRHGGEDGHSPGREDAQMVARARARRQEEGAAASRARRAARRRAREAAGLQTPPRAVDISVDSPASSVGSQDPRHESELEKSTEFCPAIDTSAIGETASSNEPARSDESKTWMQRLCCRLCCSSWHRCCCCGWLNGPRKVDRLQKSDTGSYGLAPQHDNSSSGYEPSQLHDDVLETPAEDDIETTQQGEQNRLLVTLDYSMDQTSDTSENQLSSQPVPHATVSTPSASTCAAGKPVLDATLTGDGDLRSSTPSVSTPRRPVPPFENLQGDSTPNPALRDDTAEQELSTGSVSPPALVEKGLFSAKARWERAVRKAEAVAAFVSQSDGDDETHWQLSSDGDDLVPRDYAEAHDDTDADLHPSQRRVVVSIRSRSLVDEENPESERDEPQSAANLVDARHARPSDR